MNNWIQNIKGQLTELATEVLHEATEEGQVSTSSELQVEKKRSTESERLFLSEKAKREALEKKLQELEEQLYSTNIESDAIKEKFMRMVSDRDQRIEQLKNEMERQKIYSEEKGFKSIDLDESSTILKNEEEHGINSAEITKLKEKHEREISMIMSANAANLKQMSEEYERKIRELESWSITDNANKAERNDVENSELLRDYESLKLDNQEKLAELSSIRQDIESKNQQISDLQIRIYEFQQSLESELSQKNEEMASQINEIKMLKTLNAELMSSYNEATAKLEEMKKTNNPSEMTSDLSAKINSLKSMLNETETRYELCKMEQNETGLRLENLQKEFADLRSTMQAAKATAEGNEQELLSELHSLRGTLERSKDEREKLIVDFRESMKIIKEELAQLKECNRRLVEENTNLGDSLAEFEILRNKMNNSNLELSSFREKFTQMQSEYMAEIEMLKSEKNELELKIEKSECDNGKEEESKNEEELKRNEELIQQMDILRAELKEKEEELQRLRSEKLLVSAIPGEEFKRPSSDTESAVSNPDWERMGKDEIEVEGVSSSTSEAKAEIGELAQKTEESSANFEQKNEEQLSKLKAENEEIKGILERKQAECQEYYAKMQEYSKINEEMKHRMENVEGKLMIREQEIAMRNERIAKLEGELNRLREHLMTVEEISSKEAIMAEERETELRNKIRNLQEKLDNDGSKSAKSMERYQEELIEAKERIAWLENENIQSEAILKEKEMALVEANNALKNLQIVLKELANDQQNEKQQSEKELKEIRAELMKESAILAELRQQNNQIIEERENERHQMESIKSKFDAKNALVDELENQLEDLRAKVREADKYFPPNTSSTPNTTKIDDSTLRQLFLSFFTAEKSKQPEIAIVMSKILGYSAEDQEQIQKALKNSMGGSWLFGLGGGNQGTRSELSLTEQFVRFLEQESITNAQPMMTLAVGTDQTKNDFLVGESILSPANREPSTTDLRTILDS